jgi:glycine C-acetyltransferase
MKSKETLHYHAAEDLEFSLSSHGHIDSSKYSLLETLYDPRLANLGFQQRLDVFNSYLHDLDAKDHYLYRRELASACLPVTDIMDFCDGQKRPMINLASNDYLNLSQHPRVKEAAIEAIAQYGVGSGSASMLAGTTSLHVQLEQRVAQFKGTEAAMLNSSGYALNIGTLKALLGPNDAAICDMYAHASMLDGCTHAKRYFFKHNDPISLEQTLKKAHLHANKIVVLDGVYSMDGDIAKLDEIVEIAHRHGAYVLVDEAHADGVIGPNGSGTMAHHGIVGKVDIVTGVFSKGLGGVGGYAAGNLDLIRYLHAAARSYMFATTGGTLSCTSRRRVTLCAQMRLPPHGVRRAPRCTQTNPSGDPAPACVQAPWPPHPPQLVVRPSFNCPPTEATEPPHGGDRALPPIRRDPQWTHLSGRGATALPRTYMT